MKMRVLIAGCGDLGQHILEQLQSNPQAQLFALRRNAPSLTDRANIRWLSADLTKPETLSELPEGITHIIYAAAPNERDEQAYRSTYIDGLKNIICAAESPALERIIFISSTAVYGEHGDEWVDEQTPVNPSAFNGQVLFEAEQWLEKWGQDKSIITISLRLSGIYGPGRNFLLDRLKKGQMTVPKNTHWVNRIHVQDAASAVIHMLNVTQPQDLYLVTDSTPLAARTLYEYLAKLVGGPIPAEGPMSRAVGSKRLSNKRLLDSGFILKWPDSRVAYACG